MIQFLIISDSSQLLLNKCKKTGVVKQKSKKYIFVHTKHLVTNYFCGPFTRTQPYILYYIILYFIMRTRSLVDSIIIIK